MKIKLQDIAQCKFGYYAKTPKEGAITYLQAKHFDDWGDQTEPIDTYLQLDEKTRAHLLKDGDIILAGKGNRNFAWTYYEEFGLAIPSSIFFVIRPFERKIIPEFLTAILNLKETQVHFHSLGAGSSVPSIRKSEIEAFSFFLPDIKEQRRIVEYKTMHAQDMALSQNIIEVKRKLYESAVKKLLDKNR